MYLGAFIPLTEHKGFAPNQPVLSEGLNPTTSIDPRNLLVTHILSHHSHPPKMSENALEMVASCTWRYSDIGRIAGGFHEGSEETIPKREQRSHLSSVGGGRIYRVFNYY